MAPGTACPAGRVAGRGTLCPPCPQRKDPRLRIAAALGELYSIQGTWTDLFSLGKNAKCQPPAQPLKLLIQSLEPGTSLGAAQGKDVELNTSADNASEGKRKETKVIIILPICTSSPDWLLWHLLLVASTQLRQAKDQRLDKSSTQKHATGTQSAPTSYGRETTLPGSAGKEANPASIR
ncbi:hypothetical protein DUI87_14851 [Hirundo rustica rustica]|uniref:Uncharacterized protein n=1 Tax=Hirundo rustica rustica TaxID=333673 RepID=A0A3M0K5Z7_HIRRU|nr:hypothetical protein DUI87_14851 [Hirundo rustica rustica]